MLRAAVQGRLRLVDYLARVSLPAEPVRTDARCRRQRNSAGIQSELTSVRGRLPTIRSALALLGKGVPLIGSALTRQRPAGTRDGVGLVGEYEPGRYASEGEGVELGKVAPCCGPGGPARSSTPDR